ncbi:YhgE/Pip family protein [Rhodoferax sp.]|jgi:putative membrane protein|uniref:YhgE/Pip family protein n=1 Tax=Rhodoferax sp. TaxID=50421 RepID=UPI003784852C
MKLFSHAIWIARMEARFFLRFPKLLVAAVLVAALPSLYALIYLSSIWDPASKTGALPVGLVNLDTGTHYREHTFNVGAEVAAELRQRHTFGFVDIATEAQARHMVRQGGLAFALIIPADFSDNAVPGHTQGAGKLVVFASEGNNYESAAMAKTFARELGHDVNESLNERRWNLVLLNAAGSQRSLDALRERVGQLRAGAHEISRGSAQLQAGAARTAEGSKDLAQQLVRNGEDFKQLAAGLRTLDAKRARNRDLDLLNAGAESLTAGHAELSKGLGELQGGSKQMREQVAAYRTEASDSVFTPTKITEGLDQLYAGVVELDTGLGAAMNGQQKLAQGAAQLGAGVGTLTTGVRAMNAGVRSVVNKLPDDSQLDALGTGATALSAGARTVADGSARLALGNVQLETGLTLLERSLPGAVDAPDGSPRGLATSVVPQVELDAPVANSGNAFAANVIPAALWLGAGIAAFLINVRVQPRQARFFSQPAQLLGKLALPLALVAAQTVLIWLTVRLVLQIQVVHGLAFAVGLAVSALAFLAFVFALTRALGDVGKGLAMLFLALQISSSGGILPVELSGSLYTTLSPWLPLTWVVRALKAAMFGAYGGAWLVPTLLIALAGLVALASACWVGRWRYVKAQSLRPAIDF